VLELGTALDQPPVITNVGSAFELLREKMAKVNMSRWGMLKAGNTCVHEPDDVDASVNRHTSISAMVAPDTAPPVMKMESLNTTASKPHRRPGLLLVAVCTHEAPAAPVSTAGLNAHSHVSCWQSVGASERFPPKRTSTDAPDGARSVSRLWPSRPDGHVVANVLDCGLTLGLIVAHENVSRSNSKKSLETVYPWVHSTSHHSQRL
jgi:hypothetical protein